MALQGNLRDLGLVEVLQLLSAQEKTGTLRVHSEAGRRALVIAGGRIVSAWDAHASARDPFREFLLRREVVPRDAVQRVLKAETTSPHSFADLVLRLRVVTSEDLREAFTEHIEEEVEALLGLRSGTFEFFPHESVAMYAPGLALDADALLMEAARRADEAAAAPRPEEPPAREEAREPARPAARLLGHATALALVLAGSVFGFRLFEPRSGASGPVGPVGVVLERIEAARRDRGLVALRTSLEMFRNQRGRYPSELSELAAEGLMGREEVRALRSLQIFYAPLDGGRSYRLEAREDAEVVRRPTRRR